MNNEILQVAIDKGYKPPEINDDLFYPLLRHWLEIIKKTQIRVEKDSACHKFFYIITCRERELSYTSNSTYIDREDTLEKAIEQAITMTI